MEKAKKDNYNKPFPKRLRELLNNSNDCSPLKRVVYQNELAEAIGVTRQSINSYTLGTSFPRLDDAIKIADYFNVTLDFLTGKANGMTPDSEEINKVLGLSDKAIRVLSLLNDPRFKTITTYTINLINFLIEQEELPPYPYYLFDDKPRTKEEYKIAKTEYEKAHQEWVQTHVAVLSCIYNYFMVKNTDKKIYIGYDGTIFNDVEITFDDDGNAIYDGVNVKDDKNIIEKVHGRFLRANKTTQIDITDNVLLYDIQDKLKKSKKLWQKDIPNEVWENIPNEVWGYIQGESDGNDTETR